MSDTMTPSGAGPSSASPSPPCPPPLSKEPEKPEEPYSIFDKKQRYVIVAIATTAATFSGFASNIYFPALTTLARDLNVSVELVNLSVTSFLIFQGLAPSVWGPVSDAKGRRVAYCGTFVVFFSACIGLAELKDYATLIALRCLQSAGSASTIALGAGVLADVTTRAERGGLMGILQAGQLAPVAVGPVVGGALAGSLGWRSIFWFLAIYSGVFLITLLVFLPETLRSIVGNGSLSPRGLFARFPLNVYQRNSSKHDHSRATSLPAPAPTSTPVRNRIDLVDPFRILFSRYAGPIILVLAVHYAVWLMNITAMSTLFRAYYGLSETQVGLTFIANGVGSVFGTLSTGKILDIDYRRLKKKFQNRQSSGSPASTEGQVGVHASSAEADFPLEQARLRHVPIFSALQTIAVILFGWTVQYPHSVNITVPIVATFIIGWTVVGTQSSTMTYLVDIFPGRSAAASASLNLARCLLAAGGTSFIIPMVDGIGVGWAFTICGIVQIVSLAGVAIQWRFGAKWRREAEKKKAEMEESEREEAEMEEGDGEEGGDEEGEEKEGEKEEKEKSSRTGWHEVSRD